MYIWGTVLILLLMAYQDIRSRSITILLFLALAFAITASVLEHSSWQQLALTTSVNLVFVLLHLLAVVLYLFVKNKKLINPFASHLGAGDLLFWVAMAPAFSPFNYILTFLLSVTFSTCVSVLIRYVQRERTVPLAGLQALFYAGIFAANFLFLHQDFHDDLSLLYLLV